MTSAEAFDYDQAVLDETENWYKNAERLARRIKQVVFSKEGFLDIGTSNAMSMLGRCQLESDFQPAEPDMKWQCGESLHDSKTHTMKDFATNYIQMSPNGIDFVDHAYLPDEIVYESVSNFTGVSIHDLKHLTFLSGLNQSSSVDNDDWLNATNLVRPSQKAIKASKGKWCGMPLPAMHSDKSSIAQNYWTQCVMPKAGYFDVLRCKDVTNGAYAVLGFAALNQGVCYPAHEHYAAETYWQIGGRAIWRKWREKCSQESAKIGANNIVTSCDTWLNNFPKQISLKMMKEVQAVFKLTSIIVENLTLPNGEPGPSEPDDLFSEAATSTIKTTVSGICEGYKMFFNSADCIPPDVIDSSMQDPTYCVQPDGNTTAANCTLPPRFDQYPEEIHEMDTVHSRDHTDPMPHLA